jgi:hypothetical protein
VLAEAIDVDRRCLALAPRAEKPLDWAKTQVNVGNALVRFDEREGGTAKLEEAAVAYREALKELTRARAGNAIAALCRKARRVRPLRPILRRRCDRQVEIVYPL